MVMNIRDSAIMKKYSTQVEFIQAQYSHPGSSTLEVTYSPPSNEVFVPIFGSSGAQIYGWGKVTSYVDGTIFYDDMTSSQWVENLMPIGGLWSIKNIIKYTIENTDTVAHNVDFVLAGVLIPISRYDEFVKEISGEMDREIQKDILKSLHRVEGLLVKSEFKPIR